MSKMLSFVYCSMFLVNFVAPHDVQNTSPIENIKLSKHRHHKDRPTMNAEKRIREINTEANPTTTDKQNDSIEDMLHTSTPVLLNISIINPEDTTKIVEENTSKRDTTDSLAKILNLSLKNNSSSEEYSNSNDFDDSSKNDDSSMDDSEMNNYTEENSSSNTRKSLSQDPVLDVRARSGFVEPEDNSYEDTLSDVTEASESKTHDDSRSGKQLVNPADEYNTYTENIPVDSQDTSSPSTTSPAIDDYTEINSPLYPRSEMLYNTLLNSRRRFSPSLYETIPSKEIIYPAYPTHNNRDVYQGNGIMTNPYFGILSNSQQPTYRDQCSKCYPGSMTPATRRSLGDNSFETNVKAIDNDPSNSNAYPLVEDNNVESKRAQSFSNEVLYPRENLSRDGNSYQLPNVPADPFSRILLQVPQFNPRSSPIFRRLLSLQRFV